MLVVEGLTCRFGTKAAVDNASFSIPPGSFVGVIGRSGAGKSTLLRMINRLAEPTEGRILFEGIDVTANRLPRRAFRHRAPFSHGLARFTIASMLYDIAQSLDQIVLWRIK